jgi:hypothetical protein
MDAFSEANLKVHASNWQAPEFPFETEFRSQTFPMLTNEGRQAQTVENTRDDANRTGFVRPRLFQSR